LFNLKNKLTVLFKALLASLIVLGTQVISVAGMLGPMVTPLLLWVLVAPYRPYAPLELSGIFLCYGNILALIIFYSGIVIFCVSLLQWFLYRHKKHRFFTKGLYAKIRHPQFLGIILVSLGLTITLFSDFGWSSTGVYNYLPHHIGRNELIGLWFLQVLCYIAFAFLEEWSLSKRFSEFKEYKEKVPLILPVKNPKIIPEAVFTIMLVLIVCIILFFLPYDLFWLRLP